ncbi:UNVERIFIED_CONTAM: Retrovirus-related Pol polyprotein from transposon TNT 1-94 [Sesamum calycinum]|uniref:Retrovirus-related Pol polyprotein from transposon TNT 1-94 n=1 Tax=Sesamum calycinum TaxID=2727403 RepID=A0AAW2PP57_9LAMI
MVEEMVSLQKNHTWELVQLPEGKKAIKCKWVYRKKLTVSEKEGKKFKAQLVAKGYSQQKGIDYDEICSPVNMHDVLALKALLSHEFDMKDLGAATKILRIEIHKDRAKVPYASAVGYMMYAMVCTRPDLAHVWHPLVKVLREAEGKEGRTKLVQKVYERQVLMDDPSLHDWRNGPSDKFSSEDAFKDVLPGTENLLELYRKIQAFLGAA